MTLRAFLVVFALLQVLDIVTTAIGMHYGAEETNPLALNGHILWLVAVKTVVMAFIWWAATRHPRELFATSLVALLTGFYALVIANNITTIGQLT